VKEVGRLPTPDERRALTEGLPRAGHCASCVHLRLLASKTSVFVRCALAEEDPRFAKYPPLPVLACAGHQPGVSP
jgi:hypothetical protein